jgi:protein tyrosine/serine phosphatase
LLTVVPYVHYRDCYTHRKRLREVVPGVLYRSGQLTAEGFADTVARFGIRTIVNVQDDYPDPAIETSYFKRTTVRESELCRRLGVRFVFIAPDLISRRLIPAHRPVAIEQFLAVMDDPANYPVLLHCRAGLHRTGVLTTIFRMEYQGWSHRDALEELRRNGFGEYPSTAANDYIKQYLLSFQPGRRLPLSDGSAVVRASAP